MPDVRAARPEGRRGSLAKHRFAAQANEEPGLISLKKYLDREDVPAQPASAARGESDTALECYRGVLLAVGENAAQGCPAVGAELASGLQALERRLSIHASPISLERTHEQVKDQLRDWSKRTSNHLDAATGQMKELLILMANTAEGMSDQTKERSAGLGTLTARLEKIATLDDLAEVRGSLLQGIVELRGQVDQMKQDSRRLVDDLRSEVSKCESRIRLIETLVLRDELTGIASRRSVEDRMQLNLALEQIFCLVMLDLNGFKQVNDAHGHLAGDDLLRQFALELQSNTRAGDMVGRWGGDEFVVLLSGNLDVANDYVQRIKKWVFGPYKLQHSRKAERMLHMDAAVGVAEWTGGLTSQELVARADAAMYLDKHGSRATANA
jgi:diguanylate cyclase (GGDEF)-like protein